MIWNEGWFMSKCYRITHDDLDDLLWLLERFICCFIVLDRILVNSLDILNPSYLYLDLFDIALNWLYLKMENKTILSLLLNTKTDNF